MIYDVIISSEILRLVLTAVENVVRALNSLLSLLLDESAVFDKSYNRSCYNQRLLNVSREIKNGNQGCQGH